MRIQINHSLEPTMFKIARNFETSVLLKNCAHGPQVWPWWKLFWLRFSDLKICPPSTGYRMWVYTRWGAAYFDLNFDRRDLTWAK